MKKNKDFLFKELSSRLPYGVKIFVESHNEPLTILSINSNGHANVKKDKGYPFSINWENCKLYLYPLSRMTKKEYYNWDNTYFPYLISGTEVNYPESEKYIALSHLKSIEWLYKYHYDINDLIEKGLAIDATNLNIY